MHQINGTQQPPNQVSAPSNSKSEDNKPAGVQGAQYQRSGAGTQSQNSGNKPRSGNAQSTGVNNDIDNMPQENIYHQNLPEENEEQVQDPQLLPIHFSYNFMARDHIPLHNEKFSRMNNEHQKQTEVVQKGFFDKTVPTPSHVVLNHINSWDVMTPQDPDHVPRVPSESTLMGTMTEEPNTAPTVASTSGAQATNRNETG